MSSFPSNSLFNDQFQRQAEFWNKLQEQTGVQPGETVIVTNYPTKVVTADRVDTSSNKKKTSNTYAPLYSAYGGGYGGSYGASASGSVGPGGVYQSVSTSPGHTLSSRFGDAPTSTYYSSGTPGGFSGISTSSFSDSSGNRQASTTVNNNGKVTTYHTRN